jgi:hypothetical protein
MLNVVVSPPVSRYNHLLGYHFRCRSYRVDLKDFVPWEPVSVGHPQIHVGKIPTSVVAKLSLSNLVVEII